MSMSTQHSVWAFDANNKNEFVHNYDKVHQRLPSPFFKLHDAVGLQPNKLDLRESVLCARGPSESVVELFRFVLHGATTEDIDAYSQPQHHQYRGPHDDVGEQCDGLHLQKHGVASLWIVVAAERLADVSVRVLERCDVVDVMLPVVGADVQRTLKDRRSVTLMTCTCLTSICNLLRISACVCRWSLWNRALHGHVYDI